MTKIVSRQFWNHHLRDGLNAPMHILGLSAITALFGSLRARIDFDLFERRPYAFGILRAADQAKALGIRTITICEFGVASGVGLRSMARIAYAIQNLTGVTIDVVGFDTGTGMPQPQDYRDHPEYYSEGDFAPPTPGAVEKTLPANARLIIGPISNTAHEFLATFSGTLGFISIDVDYYSSATDCMPVFTAPSERYLPAVPVFFDDVLLDNHNDWAGERLAIGEFNAQHSKRKIARYNALRSNRIMKNASWIEQMYCLHVLDHSARSTSANSAAFKRKM